MIELYLWVGVLFASYEMFGDCSRHFRLLIELDDFLKYVAVIVLWPGYMASIVYEYGIIDKLKTDYLPKLKSWIDRKRGKEAASE